MIVTFHRFKYLITSTIHQQSKKCDMLSVSCRSILYGRHSRGGMQHFEQLSAALDVKFVLTNQKTAGTFYLSL